MTRMRVFWSVYCILVGVALLVKILFRLDFSGWTVAFAILLLESGVFLVTGGFGLRRGRSAQGSGDYFFYSGEIELPASENAPGAHHRLFQRRNLVHRRDASRHARDLPVQQHHDPRPGGLFRARRLLDGLRPDRHAQGQHSRLRRPRLCRERRPASPA